MLNDVERCWTMLNDVEVRDFQTHSTYSTADKINSNVVIMVNEILSSSFNIVQQRSISFNMAD